MEAAAAIGARAWSCTAGTPRTTSTRASGAGADARDAGVRRPVYIENTPSGENAVAKRFDALAISGTDRRDEHELELGFCFDTCHAHAAGEELETAIERVLAITGKIDLVHANDSRDAAGTGADRHEAPGEGSDRHDEIRRMIRACDAAGAAVIVETPDAGVPEDIAFVREALGG